MNVDDGGVSQGIAAEIELDSFSSKSGSWLERVIFNHRGIILAACLFLTVLLGLQLGKLRLEANFESTVPVHHPYVLNFLVNRDELADSGNSIKIAVENPRGSIYDPAYLEILRKITEEVFLLPGVYRQYMKSLWTPNAVWTAVTNQGLDSGPIMPPEFDGSAQAIRTLQSNILRAGEIGRLVADDQRSSIIRVPLLAMNPATQAPIDYAEFALKLENIRTKYETQGVHLHVTGYAQIVGDILHGMRHILGLFVLAVVVTVAILYAYTRCARSTFAVVICSLIAVIWELGALPALGLALDPYSILVPFLVFAIGVSHGAQKMNGIMQDIGRGASRIVAARLTFRRLFLAGLTALVCDALGFGLLSIVDIGSIRQLAWVATIGVAALIFTNLIFLPIILSYIGVRVVRSEGVSTPNPMRSSFVHHFLGKFTDRRWATITLVFAGVLAVGAAGLRTQLKIGDTDQGAPELRADSRYNQDDHFITSHYRAGSDLFAVMVKTADGECGNHETLHRVDVLEWRLAQLPGVQSTQSAASFDRYLLTIFNEGHPKWYDLTPNVSLLNNLTARVPRDLVNESCNLLSIWVQLKDHKADTLNALVATVEQFKREYDSQQATFLLAAGNGGIAAATNLVVHEANQRMLFWVFGVVMLLCFIAFRSWRAVVCVLLPLMLSSLLCEALMVVLGIGVKVTTLPVIALGVGIGVDYALYVMSVMLAQLRLGATLSDAYKKALQFTGKVVVLTGATLAVGVFTWIFSPIKFQADMGALLVFMFLWNMLGALVLLPALASWLMDPRNSVAKQENVRSGQVCNTLRGSL